MVSTEKVASILKAKGIQLADLASEPARLERAIKIAYKAIPIPVRWFIGRDRVRRLVTGLASQFRGLAPPSPLGPTVANLTPTPKGATMKLHTETKEGKAGLVFKKTAYYMSYRLELSEEEQRILTSHPEIGKMIIGTGTFGVSSPLEITISVNMAVKGSKESEFASLARQSEFEQSLRQGCAALKEHFLRLGQVGAGPTTVEF